MACLFKQTCHHRLPLSLSITWKLTVYCILALGLSMPLFNNVNIKSVFMLIEYRISTGDGVDDNFVTNILQVCVFALTYYLNESLTLDSVCDAFFPHSAVSCLCLYVFKIIKFNGNPANCVAQIFASF